jgi:hypothetical protein
MYHYESLGFEVKEYDSGGYGLAKRNDVVIHLTAQIDFDPLFHASAAYLYVEDAVALAHEWRQPNINGRTLMPVETSYGLLEGVHIDTDHNVIRFGSPNSRVPSGPSETVSRVTPLDWPRGGRPFELGRPAEQRL